MTLLDFNAHFNERNSVTTPEQTAQDIAQIADELDIEYMFCVFKTKGGELGALWSDVSPLELLGALDVVKLQATFDALGGD